MGSEMCIRDRIEAIAATAIRQGTGARGLRSIIERALEDTMYDLPQWRDVARVVVDADAIDGTGRPVPLAPGQRFSDVRERMRLSVVGGDDGVPTADIAIVRSDDDAHRDGPRRA